MPGARSGAAHRCPAQADPGGRGALPPEPGGPGGAGAPDGRRLRTAGALLLRGQERDDLPACAGWEEQASGVRKVAEGSICAANINLRRIMEEAAALRAPQIYLAHNHISNLAFPSPVDISTTQTMRTALAGVGIELLDHLVFVDGDMVSMRDSGMMK